VRVGVARRAGTAYAKLVVRLAERYSYIPHLDNCCSDRCAKGGNCVDPSAPVAAALFAQWHYPFSAPNLPTLLEWGFVRHGEP